MKAFITQRESIDKYGVPVDIMESNYITYFDKLGFNLIVVSNFHNNLHNYINSNKDNIDLLILSGGGDNNQTHRNKTEFSLLQYAITMKIPILCICRGMQIVNEYYGGKTTKLDNLKVKRKIRVDHPVAVGDKEIYVNNYHNYGIYLDDLAKPFTPLAIDKENSIIEAYYCNSECLNVLAFQWHPERAFSNYASYFWTRHIIIKFINKELQK